MTLTYGWLELRRLDKSCGWFEFRRLDTSCGWLRATADSVPWLTWVPAAKYELQLTPSYGWLEFYWLDTSCSWFYQVLLAGLDCFINIWSKFKDLLCKIHQFYGLFSTAWFQLPLIRALAAAWRTLKKLEEAWRSLRKLEEVSRL